MNAKLPNKYKKQNLHDILVGETVYTVPWAMYADENCDLWLNGNYSFYDSPMGTATMSVSRTKRGYIVDIFSCSGHYWNCSKPAYVGKFVPIPVIEIKGR